MADKRTFDRNLICSEDYKALTPPAQCLYVQLSFAADNDGFVKAPGFTARSSGFTEREIDELIQKDFLLPFGSDVVLIAHWHINNYIRKERIGQTEFKAELQLVELDDEHIYRMKPGTAKRESSRKGSQSGSQPSSQPDSQVKEQKRESTSFKKPDLEEVRAFIREKGYHVDADAWYSHYESNGWMVGKNKMKSWQASINYWEQNNKKGAFNNGSTKPDGNGNTGSGSTGSEYGQSPFFPYQPQWYGGESVFSPGDWSS